MVAVLGLVILLALALATSPARTAALDENDTSRLADVTEAIKSFENDVSSALHDLSPNDAEQIESYAYVQLNLEAAHEDTMLRLRDEVLGIVRG